MGGLAFCAGVFTEKRPALFLIILTVVTIVSEKLCADSWDKCFTLTALCSHNNTTGVFCSPPFHRCENGGCTQRRPSPRPRLGSGRAGAHKQAYQRPDPWLLLCREQGASPRVPPQRSLQSGVVKTLPTMFQILWTTSLLCLHCSLGKNEVPRTAP